MGLPVGSIWREAWRKVAHEFPDNAWRRVVVEHAKLKGGPHKARHTFASHLLAAKPDLFLLGRILGHSHSRVTELYSHLIPEHLVAARDVVTFELDLLEPRIPARSGGVRRQML